MKNETPEIVYPDGLGICDDCKEEYSTDELKKCSGCHMILCEICYDLHSDEHYSEEDEEEDEQWGSKNKSNE